jgi:hypothetical protein
VENRSLKKERAEQNFAVGNAQATLSLKIGEREKRQ